MGLHCCPAWCNDGSPLNGGESCADIDILAPQDRLFGDVASDTTVYRTFTESLDPATVERARRAMGLVRSEVWRRTTATDGDDPVIAKKQKA